MPKNKIYFVVLVAILLTLGFFYFRSQADNTSDETKRTNLNQTDLSTYQPASSYDKKLFINENEINIEIADTNESRKQGLSGRQSMPMDSGMLFIFDKAGYYSFWMPDTYFPLDFIWINGDTIVDITENVPNHPGPQTKDLPLYKPSQPADKILELNAGVAKSLEIKVGNKIRYE